MNNYAKGANRERLFIKMLLKGWNGWPPALWAGRTAGSHSKLDVVAIYCDVVRVFQLKSGSGRLDDVEVGFLLGVARATSGLCECYGLTWPDYQPPVLRRVR